MRAKFPMRFLSYLLSFTMLFSLLDFTAFAVDGESTENDGGFTLSLKWNGADQDPNIFDYDSQYDENRLVRLKVSYYNESVVNSYGVGQIIISVPGIKDAVRSGESYIPAALAADKASDTTKQYDWSYTYSSSSDTFTFTNNFTVEESASLEGSFEIIWDLYSRNTIHDFFKDFQAKLRTGKSEQVTSNVISYSQTRKKDEYTLSMNSEKLYSDEGFGSIIPAGSSVEDYQWIRYNVYGTDTYYARDVEGDERFDFYVPQGSVVKGESLRKSGRTETIDDLTYDIWTVEKNVGNYSYNYLYNVYVGYPLTLKDKTPFDIRVDIVGKYYDENTDTILAQTYQTINSLDDKYLPWNGEIYSIGITNYGVGSYYSSHYISDHCNHCYSFGAVNAAHMAAGSQEYYSNLRAYLFYDKYVDRESNPDDNIQTFDFELIDDFIDVYTTSGDKRQLNDDEYNFTSLSIPAASNITNTNDITVTPNKYGVEVYVRRAGEADFDSDSVVTTQITASSQDIALPDDSVSVKIVVTGIQESFRPINFNIRYKFHTTADDINYDGGSMINNIIFRLFGHETGEWVDEGAFTEYNYYSNEDYERDMNVYGYTALRAQDSIHILEIPNEYYSSTHLYTDGSNTESYFFKSNVDAHFTIPEENSLSNFSIYTILPDDMKLQRLYSSKTALLETLTFSCNEYPSDYIKDHAVIKTIDTDYQGSGRTYIAISFDFSDEPIRTSLLQVQNFPLRVDREKISNSTRSFTFRTLMLIDQSGKWYAPNRDNNSFDSNLWRDIDNDGDVNEYAALSSWTTTVYNPQNSNMQFNKSISTTLTNGYVQPVQNAAGDGYQSDSMPTTYRGLTYSYKLKLRTGESIAGNIILADNLEAGDLSEWQGTLQSIDTTYAEELFGKKPTVYYSSQKVNLRVRPDLTDSSVWSTTKPDSVKSVAIDFGDSKLTAGKTLYVEIYLNAPTSTDFEHKITENSSVAFYDKFNESGVLLSSSLINSNTAAATLIPFMGTIKITKSDAFSGDKLQNAVFALYKMSGNRPDISKDKLVTDSLTTNDAGNVSIRVEYGKYYVIERVAPIGYELDETPHLITLDATEPDISVTAEITNQRKSGQMLVYKISDRDNDMYLEGAEFSVYNEKDELVQEKLVTDENGELTIVDLPWGKYYLVETKAPSGFKISSDKIEFTVSADNDAGRLGDVTVSDKQIPATAILVKHEMLEDGTTITDVPLDGAAYELHKSDGSLLGTYMTDDEGKIYVDDLDFGSYYFIETIAAQGYEKLADKIEFEINGSDLQKDGTVSKTIQTSDKRLLGKVWLQKTDNEGDYVRNAEYALFNKDDNQIDETGALSRKTFTTNAEGIFEITGLYWGDYYLQEVTSPVGYELNNTKYNFTVSRTTVNNTFLFRVTDDRSKGAVELTKVDADDINNVLQGAVYTLYMNNGTVYKDDLVTDANGKILVTDLPWGTYYFLEKEPPENFSLSDDKIRFSINYLSAGKTQAITATDKQTTGEVTVIKQIAIDDIILAHGSPYFTFKLTGKDSNGVDRTCFKRVSFNEEYVKALLESGASEAELSFTFTDLGAGTWTVSEETTSRYDLSEATALTANGDSDGTTVKFTLDDDAGFSGTAKFVNKKTVQSSTSHTDSVVNLLKKSRLVTGISAIWTGGNLSETTLNRDDVAVFVTYDDGTEERLANDAYTLSKEEFDIGISATYVIDVTYTDPNTLKIYTDSFSINVNTPVPFTWTVEEGVFISDGEVYDGKATITGYTGDSSVMNIPSEVVGLRSLVKRGDNTYSGAYTYTDNGCRYLVTGISGESAESGNLPMYGVKNKVDSIILPDTLNVIGAYSFYECDSLSLGTELPSKLSEISDYAFSGCLGLNGKLEIPTSVQTIGECAFKDCTNLSGELNVGGGDIGKNAFINCTGISKLTLGDNVTSIGEGAFSGCTNLSGTLTIPASVIYIGKNAFGNSTSNLACSRLSSLKFADNSTLTEIGEYAFANCTSLNGSLTVPDSVTSIGQYAFYNCTAFNGTVTVKSGSIGKYAFAKCTGFTGIKLEEGVSYIGDYAFSRCTNLTGSLNIPSTVTYLGNYSFGSNISSNACSGLTSVSFADDILLETIGTCAFAYCTGLQGELKLPDSLLTIRESAFRNCNNISNIVIPNGIQSIDNRVFESCSGITSVTLPESLTSLGYATFKNCHNLKAVEINSNLKQIRFDTFRGCSSLTDISIPESVTIIGSSAFESCSSLQNLTFLDNIKTIDNSAFRYCSSLTDISIPESVTSIGSYAFANCSNLKSITLPDSVNTINSYTFYNCSSLTDVSIPESVTSIGSSAFEYCSSLQNLTFLDNIKTIDSSAFRYCSSLTDVSIPESVTSIGSSAFESCRNLKSIILPDSISTINDNTFYNCYSLTDISIPESVTSIGSSAFESCRNLKSIALPDSISIINGYAFRNCSSLTDISIPDSVASIGSCAFESCSSLQSLTLPDSIRTIESYAFRYCYNLTLIVNDGVTSIGYNAFYRISKLCYHGQLSGSPWGANSTCPGDLTLLSITKEPTCTETGEGIYSCNFSGKELYSTVPKLPHTPDENNYCTVCGADCSLIITNTSNNQYRFTQDGTKWTSNNFGVHNSTAYSEWTIEVVKAMDYTFYYSVSSEGGCDWLNIVFDGSTIVSQLYGTNHPEYSYTVHLSAGTHTISASYRKDGSVNSGSDCAYIILPDEL